MFHEGRVSETQCFTRVEFLKRCVLRGFEIATLNSSCVFYFGASRTPARVRNRNNAFHCVVLTLEPLNQCMLRRSSLSNIMVYEGKSSRPLTLLCVFETPKHRLR